MIFSVTLTQLPKIIPILAIDLGRDIQDGPRPQRHILRTEFNITTNFYNKCGLNYLFRRHVTIQGIYSLCFTRPWKQKY